MPKEIVSNGGGAATIPAYSYLRETRYATLEYYTPGRTRTKPAQFVLGLFCSITGSAMITPTIGREELMESYDLKLWSYNDRLVLFVLATIPSLITLTTLYVTFRAVMSLHKAISR